VYILTKMLGSFIQMEIQIVFRSLTVSAVKFTLAKMFGSFSEIEKQVDYRTPNNLTKGKSKLIII
jgi:hypothetical protein